MPRGGKRDKAGRPSTWASGCKFEDTRVIRVPAAIADRTLEVAHKLDAGETLDLVTKFEIPLSQALEPNQLEILSLDDSSWKLGATTKIDVPIVLSARLLGIAKRLDDEVAHKQQLKALRPPCPVCGSHRVNNDGLAPKRQKHESRGRKYECKVCGRKFTVAM